VFDLRYHVASLAAVFIALVIGILVGVGLSGRGVLREAERDSLQAEIDRLNRQSELQQQRIDELAAAAEYESATYDAVMDRRLDGKRVALVFVGPVDGGVRANVEETMERAGGTVARTRSLKVPMDALEIQDAIADVSGAPSRVEDVGRALARELLDGGETPLWNELEQLLVLEQRSTGPPDPLDGVVVMRNADPQSGGTARFLAGFYDGLRSAGVPAVGVETTGVSDEDSALPVFERHRFSSVDNIDTETGRLSLAVLLSGAERGRYGLDGEDGYVPPVATVSR
jgi:Copper transport outer membrane protein, MctB